MATTLDTTPFGTLADGIAPHYGGRGLANVTPTLLRHFGLQSERPGLDPDLLPPEFANAERVVLVVLDGLGADQFERNPASARYRHKRTLTSVLPSTTAAALATLGTGVPPGEHGFLGYRTLFPRAGTIMNMVRLRPYYGTRAITEYGFPPEAILAYRPMVERLRDAGVRVGIVTRSNFVESPLSRATYGRVPRTGYVGLADMLLHVRAFLDETRGERAYLEVYWDEIDAISHAYGPDSDAHDASVRLVLDTLAEALEEDAADSRTVVLVTADHGHVHVPRENVLNLNDHPEIMDDLVLPPTGEGRLSYLHVRDGTRERVREAVERAWPDEVTVLDAESVVDAGHYGPPPHHPELLARLGSLIVIPRGHRKIEYHATPMMGPTPLLGNHGGVQPGEMLVPLAAL